MTINYTTLLGLAEPVTGTESGTWGDDVNKGITDYLDIAVAGTQTISGTQTAVTLSITNGSSAANNIAQAGTGATGSSQYQIINCTGSPASLLTITAPASSKTYVIINATSTSQSVKIVGAGPTTGVTIASGEKSLVAWNGTDFVKVSGSSSVSSFSAGTTGFTPNTATTGAVTLAGTLGTANGGTNLTTFTSGGAVYASSTSVLTTGTLPVASGGTGQTSYTNGQLLIGNTTGNTLTKATLTAGTNITITNGNGSITIASSTATAATPTALGTVFGSTTNSSVLQTFLGYQAGNANLASANTFIGYQAGLTNISGNSNTAVGYLALTLSTGSSNTAVGGSALSTNSTGGNNTAIGHQALLSNDTGGYNTAIGSLALGINSSNSFSTGIGYTALYNATADNNTSIGYQSLKDVTTGANNTALGYNAGFTGTNNLTTGSNNILIGYQAAASSASVSNEATWGNSSITNNRFWGAFKLGGSSAGTSGQLLQSTGSGTSPTWVNGPSGTIVGTTDTQTLTNKRVTPRVSTTTSSATPTINTDNTDVFGLTAQAANITSFTTNLSGTPTDGQRLQIYIVGTAARTIAWGTSFEASTVALPTTTVTTNRLDVSFIWNAATSKWRCLQSV